MARSGPKKIKDLIGNNQTLQTYYDLDQAMVDAHFGEKDEIAESTARMLLENSELALIIRCRACMVLACGEGEDCLDMAKEAVRIAQLAYDRCSEPGDLETTLLKNAKEILKKTQERVDEMGKKESSKGK